MTGSIVVFLGPTLPQEEARAELDATYLPPVSEGDVTKALAQRPAAIGIVDGYFENVPAVWHKEILFALKQGVHVFGSASMGALRAAELVSFGMEGVGAIFEAYRDGRIEDDDEVAVSHGPAEIGYPALTEAMVNVRRTLSDAAALDILSDATRDRLEQLAKALPYKDRTWANLFDLAREYGTAREEVAALEHWLPDGRIDQKAEDARLMLKTIRQRMKAEVGPKSVRFHFEHTTLWDRAQRAAGHAGA